MTQPNLAPQEAEESPGTEYLTSLPRSLACFTERPRRMRPNFVEVGDIMNLARKSGSSRQ